jgi:exodeoxyribonuclease VII small subunit
VTELESEPLDLAAALALFEEGVACLREAAGTLSEADARVQKLTELADGAFDVAPLDDE